MIDEADAFLGDRNQGIRARATGSSRRSLVHGQHRVTGQDHLVPHHLRPDLLPIDLKRSGQAEEHHRPVLIPRQSTRRRPVHHPREEAPAADAEDERRRALPPLQVRVLRAEPGVVLIRPSSSRHEHHVFVTKGDLEETIQDFMPPAYADEIELQNLVPC